MEGRCGSLVVVLLRLTRIMSMKYESFLAKLKGLDSRMETPANSQPPKPERDNFTEEQKARLTIDSCNDFYKDSLFMICSPKSSGSIFKSS